MQNSCPKMNRRLSRVSTSILAAIFHHFNAGSYAQLYLYTTTLQCCLLPATQLYTRSSSSSSGNIIYDGDNHCRSLAATLQIYIAVSSVDFWLLSATGIFDNDPVFKDTSKQDSDFIGTYYYMKSCMKLRRRFLQSPYIKPIKRNECCIKD